MIDLAFDPFLHAGGSMNGRKTPLDVHDSRTEFA